MNLILCGMHLCGKTTIGKRASEISGWTFIDTDRIIEKAYRDWKGVDYGCREIFRQEGQELFRLLENQAITSLGVLKCCVIAIGGGSLGDPETTVFLRNQGKILYLKTDPTTLLERMQNRGFPAYLDPNNLEQAFQEVLKRRLPHYETIADMIIETRDKTIEEIAHEVVAVLKIGSRETVVGIQ